MDQGATPPRQPLKIGIVGLGLVGRQVAALFRDSKPAGLTLHAVAVRRVDAARTELDALGMTTPILPLQDLVREVDVVVEATGSDSLRGVVEATFAVDKTIVITSGAGLRHCQDLLDQSAATGRGRLILASGAMPGLDSIRTAAEAGITSIRMQSRFSVGNVLHNEYIKSLGIDVTKLTEAVLFFKGTAREAANLFPHHYNSGMTVQVAAGPGAEIELESIVDPTITTPTHRIEIETPAGGYTIESRSVLTLPTRGSRLVAPSVMACLRHMVNPLTAGS